MNNRYQHSVFKPKASIMAAFFVFAMTGLATAVAEDKLLRVTFEKTLLDTPTGVEQVYKKLKVSTRRACQRSVTNSINEREICNRQVLARFVDTLDNLQLSHYADTGQHLDHQALSAK